MITLKLLGNIGRTRTIWYEIDGFVTHVTELSRIFKIHPVTLRMRLHWGWNIAAATQVGNTESLNFNEVQKLLNDPSLDGKFIKKLESHFQRPAMSKFNKG